MSITVSNITTGNLDYYKNIDDTNGTLQKAYLGVLNIKVKNSMNASDWNNFTEHVVRVSKDADVFSANTTNAIVTSADKVIIPAGNIRLNVYHNIKTSYMV